MNYTFHQLKIFVKVCDFQSVTKAAESLYLTQPAVSIQLKKLQDEFDIPLFEVIGRKLYITDFGYTIKKYAESILETAEQMDVARNNYKGLISGDLKIASASTGKYVIPYFLSGYMKQYPEVNINIDVTNKSTVVQNLKDNIIDFAMVSTLPANMNLETVDLMSNEIHLVGSTEAFDFDTISPKNLNKQTLIMREEGSATRAAMESFLESNQIKNFRMIQLTSNEAVKQAVKAGLGLSIMPKIGIRTELKIGSMKIINVKGLPITSEWNLAYNKGKELSPAAHALIDYIHEHKEEIIESEFS